MTLYPEDLLLLWSHARHFLVGKRPSVDVSGNIGYVHEMCQDV